MFPLKNLAPKELRRRDADVTSMQCFTLNM